MEIIGCGMRNFRQFATLSIIYSTLHNIQLMYDCTKSFSISTDCSGTLEMNYFQFDLLSDCCHLPLLPLPSFSLSLSLCVYFPLWMFICVNELCSLILSNSPFPIFSLLQCTVRSHSYFRSMNYSSTWSHIVSISLRVNYHKNARYTMNALMCLGMYVCASLHSRNWIHNKQRYIEATLESEKNISWI